MTPKEIEQALKKLKELDLVKISSQAYIYFFIFRGKDKEGKFIFYKGEDWAYACDGCYLYRVDIGNVPQSKYFRKISIGEIKIFSPVSMMYFLNTFLDYFHDNQFFKFLLK